MGFSNWGFDSPQGAVLGFQPSQGAAAAATPSTLLDDLQWWYKFDTDTTWPEAITAASLWTEVNDPSLVTGKINSAIEVGISRDALSYGPSPSALLIDPDKSWSQSIWFYPVVGEPTGGTYYRVFVGYEWQMYIGLSNRSTGNYLSVTGKDAISGWFTANMSATSASEYPDTAWSHAVFTYLHKDDGGDGTNSILTMYARVGGTEYTTAHSWAGKLSDIYAGGGASGAKIGGYPGSYNYDSGSPLDLWGFWDRILTSAERSELYNSDSGKDYPFV